MSTSGFVHAQEPTNDKTNTFDFVVVGAGAAGMAAAVEARSLGASVVVLEKAPRPDGNTFYASGRLCGVGSRYQKDTGDTLEKFVNDAWHETQGVGDKKVIEAFAKESGPSIDWLIDMGVPLTLKKGLPAPNLSRAFFMTTDGTTGGSILMRKLLKKAKDEGVKLLVNTKAFALVTDPEGNVTGVQAKTPDGVKSFMATKGVIITSTSSVFLLPTQR